MSFLENLDWGTIIISTLIESIVPVATAVVVSGVVTSIVYRRLEKWKYRQEEAVHFAEFIVNTARTGTIISSVLDELSSYTTIESWAYKPKLSASYIIGEDKILGILLRHEQFDSLRKIHGFALAIMTKQLFHLVNTLSDTKRLYFDAISSNQQDDRDALLAERLLDEWSKTHDEALKLAKKLQKNVDKVLNLLNAFGKKEYKQLEKLKVEVIPPEERQSY